MEMLIGHHLDAAEATVKATVRDTEEYIRHEPLKAVLWAMLAGYLMRILPMTAIVGALLRLLLTILRPALFIFGVAKLWEALRSGSSREQPELPFH